MQGKHKSVEEFQASSNSAIKDLAWISGRIGHLQRANSMSNIRLPKLILQIIITRLLYWLSAREWLSEKRRKRFHRSAEKRDPMLLARRLDDLCHEFLVRINGNTTLGVERKAIMRGIGLSVTAIVPSCNHAAFLRQRLDSVLGQNYPLTDVVIVDDASTDGSREIITEYVERFPNRIRAVLNEVSSSSIFAQRQQGYDLATGDLVWLCEGSGFVERDFVSRLMRVFRDPSIILAFGRGEFTDAQVRHVPGLQYHRPAEVKASIRPAAAWFADSLSGKNTTPNVGESLWRRLPISQAAWDKASGYRMMGDWFLYLQVVQGGQIAVEPSAVSYFYTHDAHTLNKNIESRLQYYHECAQLMMDLKRRWEISDAAVDRFVTQAAKALKNIKTKEGENFDNLMNVAALKVAKPEMPHVLMGIDRFSYGGGEIFPIHLANALYSIGAMVTILQMADDNDHPDVRAMLDSSIPVYRADTVRTMGVNRFVREAGISIVHSHSASVEMLMLDREKEEIQIPYLVTLHGSYEAAKIARNRVAKWAMRTDQYVYTADRNLSPFNLSALSHDKFVKFRNAMPIDPSDPPQSRASLGIPKDAVVFTLVARGVKEKGWEEAVRAFQALRVRRPDVAMALVAVGEGEKTDAARRLAGNDSMIHFPGFVKEIHGIYRFSDVALAPTRFSGESFPLCLIQAMQVGVPCVATDIGDIKAMIQPKEGSHGGLIIPNLADDDAFIAAVSEQMEAMLDPALRAELSAGAQRLGEDFGLDALAHRYLELYQQLISRRAVRLDRLGVIGTGEP
jgi:glycosyltransferase involved in cell wall biosynthesis